MNTVTRPEVHRDLIRLRGTLERWCLWTKTRPDHDRHGDTLANDATEQLDELIDRFEASRP